MLYFKKEKRINSNKKITLIGNVPIFFYFPGINSWIYKELINQLLQQKRIHLRLAAKLNGTIWSGCRRLGGSIAWPAKVIWFVQGGPPRPGMLVQPLCPVGLTGPFWRDCNTRTSSFRTREAWHGWVLTRKITAAVTRKRCRHLILMYIWDKAGKDKLRSM